MTQFINEMPKFRPPLTFKKQKHLFLRYSVGQIDNVIRWCRKEYWASLAYWSKKGEFRNVRFEAEEFSTRRLMASIIVFDEIIVFIREFPAVWDSLPKESRKFLTDAYEFKKLSDQSIS